MPVQGALVANTRRPRTYKSPTHPLPEGLLASWLTQCGTVHRARRQALGLTAQAVGDRVGLTKAPVSAFEIGKGGLHLDNLLHLWWVLGIPIPSPFTPEVPPHLADIWTLLRRATPEIQAAVRAILEATDQFPTTPPDGCYP